MSNVNNNNSKIAVHKMLLYIIIMILHTDYREGVNNRPVSQQRSSYKQKLLKTVFGVAVFFPARLTIPLKFKYSGDKYCM